MKSSAVGLSVLLLTLAMFLSPLLNTGASAAGIPTRNPHHPTGTPTPTNTATITPSPTETPTSTATQTLTNLHSPTPTLVIIPTNTPHPLATATPTSAPAAALPLCATHDVNQWHALIDYVRMCHYDHEHHSNPNDPASVALFGRAGEWFGGTSISYPWQTKSVTGCLENVCKHVGYKWLVRHTAGIPSNAPGGITDFGIQFHNEAANEDTVVRFHSSMIQARACMGTRCGTIYTGGYQDFGCLFDQGTTLLIPIPQNPSDCPATISGGRQRLHFTVQDPPSFDSVRNFATWYGGHAVASLAIIMDSQFGPVDLNDPFKQVFTCPAFDCSANGSIMGPHIVSLQIDPNVFPPNSDGLVFFNGFTNVYGVVDTICTTSTLQCVPLIINGLVPGAYQYRDDVNNQGMEDFDTCRPLGQVCITFPN